MSRFFDPKYDTLEAYTPGEQPKDNVLLKLNTNECPYPTSPKVLAAIEAEKAFRLYPDPTSSRAVSASAMRAAPSMFGCTSSADMYSRPFRISSPSI